MCAEVCIFHYYRLGTSSLRARRELELDPPLLSCTAVVLVFHHAAIFHFPAKNIISARVEATRPGTSAVKRRFSSFFSHRPRPPSLSLSLYIRYPIFTKHGVFSRPLTDCPTFTKSGHGCLSISIYQRSDSYTVCDRAAVSCTHRMDNPLYHPLILLTTPSGRSRTS